MNHRSIYLRSFLFAILVFSLPTTCFSFAYKTVTEDNRIVSASQDLPAITWNSKNVSFTLDFNDSRFIDDMVYAMQEWNGVEADLNLTEGDVYAELCNDKDGVNHITMTSDNCGEVFGDILGTTRIRSVEIGNNNYIIDSDIRFQQFTREEDRWATSDEYQENKFQESKLCYRNANGGKTCDFYRVALHELGHAIGLGHPGELGQRHSAVMNRGANRLSKPFTLSEDDKAAIAYLYPPNRNASALTGGEGLPNGVSISATGNEESTGVGSFSFPVLLILLFSFYAAKSRKTRSPYSN